MDVGIIIIIHLYCSRDVIIVVVVVVAIIIWCQIMTHCVALYLSHLKLFHSLLQ